MIYRTDELLLGFAALVAVLVAIQLSGAAVVVIVFTIILDLGASPLFEL
jgi:hypothetical protein